MRFGPFFTTLDVTITAISAAIVAGGSELLPGSDSQDPPQTIAARVAYPLKLAFELPGLESPLMGLFFHHCAPQKFTTLPTACGSTSPITNTGRSGGTGGVGAEVQKST